MSPVFKKSAHLIPWGGKCVFSIREVFVDVEWNFKAIFSLSRCYLIDL